jgi:hypothetical protein
MLTGLKALKYTLMLILLVVDIFQTQTMQTMAYLELALLFVMQTAQ